MNDDFFSPLFLSYETGKDKNIAGTGDGGWVEKIKLLLLLFAYLLVCP